MSTIIELNIKNIINSEHVPKLKKNLISLGVLDSGGYEFSCQGGVLKVSKGILVVMKATKVGNLYRLEGSTYVNHAIVVYKESDESTHLWHQ